MINYYPLIFYALLLFFGQAILNAQCPEEEELIFTTQAEIDQFIVDYPNCTTVSNMYVSGVDITNLNGLVNIESIFGDLSLQNCPLLTDISGMANLSSVEHELIIFNTGIVTIDENDFGSLTHAGHQIVISSNENLQSITGFQGINELYNLVIEHNPALTNLNAFNNLTGLGDVHFSYLSSLESVDGFNSLGTIGLGSLNINSTPLLNDLGVLGEIGISSLNINNVPWTSLDLFSNNSFWFGVSISNCPNLVDISQLVNISGCSYFYVFNNPNLSECCTLSYLIDFNNGFIEIDIGNNAYGCNSLGEIELECIIIPSCPPGDLTFTNQAELNQFLIDYPDCPQIFGTLTISGNDIINLDALANIEHISGDFIIQGNPSLTEIGGFINLQTISGALSISDNNSLQIISGFQNLTTVAGDVEFSLLPSLTDIYNFNSLTNVGGSFQFTQLGLLENLSAFFNLESVAASFTLANNNQINDLNNFCSLTTVGALNISSNQSLADCCSIQPLAQALGGTDAIIENNAFGCNSLIEIEADCQAQPVGTCPSGDLDLYSQAEIDQFAIDYPNCTEINGSISISGNDIINLDALQNIETIAGDFYISGTTLLTEINGFNKLESVGGSLVYIDYNQGLVSVNGFNNLKSHIAELGFYGNENLESVEGFESLTSIYNILFYNCPSLVSVTNFANLTTVEGSLSFWQTPALQSINAFSALESIIWNLSITNTNYFNDLSSFESLTSVGGLNIYGNSGLSNCCIISQFISEETIWDDINIHSNAVGCNSYYESYNSCIEEKCPEGDLVFTSQAEIDQFIIDYPYCAEIEGNVEIVPTNNPIFNLNGLQNLTLITGNLSIMGSDIVDLDGLENLYYIGGDFTIINNLALDSIHALNGFNYIGGSLTLAGNTNLSACCAIFEIQNAVVGTINIYNNAEGCNSLTQIVEACTPIITGCMDDTACNYDANANTDDGSCIYATGCDVCDGEGGVIDNLDLGEACDDGDETTINDSIQADCSCLGMPIVTGCMDDTACNYDENANVNDGSCIYATGCDVCDGEGGVIDNLEVGEACDDGDETTIDDTIQSDCSCAGIPIILGCMDETACNYKAVANVDDGNCIYATGCDVCDGAGGVIDNLEVGEACDDGDETTMNDIIQLDCSCAGIPIIIGCMDDTACNYDSNANADDGSCIYATGCDVCDGEGGLIDNLEVGMACDDGDETTMDDTIQSDCSCAGVPIVMGCMYTEACNYNENANVDDGSCIYAIGCDVCDGAGGVIDNLEVGEACNDGDETTTNDMIQSDCSCLGVPIVTGCMDDMACNYDENANVDDGSCIYATGCDVCDGAGGVIDNLEVGETCDDGDDNTINDIIQPDCSCSGTLSCPTGDVLISNQAELLQFIENYTNCTEIVGNLIINGDEITDIGFLQNIINISGSCAIVGTSLSDLSGLDNLTYIGGDLQILSNPLLQNIDVLTNVSFIGYDLNVESNASLTTCCIILDLIEATNNQYLIQNNGLGCENFEVIESTCPVNINGITSNKASNLLVMISGGHLSFKFKITNQNLDAIIYDINGRQMLQSPLAAQQQIHHIKITALPIGTYFLVVKDNEHLLTAKFFKK